MGDTWQHLRRAVADAPVTACCFPLWRMLTGLMPYGGLIWLHPMLFGVSPLP